MPQPADQNAGAPAEDAGRPQLRRRRDLRRADGTVGDAWIGTIPAVTPSPSSQNGAGKPATRRTSWAEAAAAADATKPSRASAPTRTPPQAPAAPPTAPVSPPAEPIASVPGTSLPGTAETSAAEPARRAGGVAPEAAAPSSDTPSFRRSRPAVADAIAESPVPDFISSPGLFVKEQKPRPVGGFPGAMYKLTGGAWNLGPSQAAPGG